MDFGRVLGGRNPRFSHFFRNFFEANFKGFLGRLKNRKKSKKKLSAGDSPEILGRPGGMCVARGRDREGVIRRSRPRLLKLSNLGLTIFGQDFDFGFSTRRHLRWGGGTLRAFRRPHLGCLELWSWEVSKNQGRILIFKFPNP